MKNDNEPKLDEGRREFLRQAGRWAVALALGGGVALLARGSGNACPQPCAACPEWAGCRKPNRDPRARQ